MSYFLYWGKARKEGEQGAPYHLLPYHCLDVAAVADVWFEQNQTLQYRFQSADLTHEQLKAWLLFFIALHDYGKLDMRFQLKAPQVVQALRPEFDAELVDISRKDCSNYFHGPKGFALFYYDFQADFGWHEDDERWLCWAPWFAAVAGHHGVIPDSPEPKHLAELSESHADSSIIQHDQQARREWVYALEALFLQPVGLSIQDKPPAFNAMLAGLCSVADWMGSNSEVDAFEFQDYPEDLACYYVKRLPIACKQLAQSGLFASKQPYLGVSALLPEGEQPRQLQVLLDRLPVETGLTLIEAPTGSGKTETALAYAWRLLDAGLADSIIFALPTQATANAMLKRLEQIAPKLFQGDSNLVLAHGKSGFNDDFWRIQERSRTNTAQGSEEAKVQCAHWLASSRKRIFLGQIGVCTIDQVLISVLPVLHKFVRGFGLGKSVLIVDEVHAYDSYMYGLLGEVLRQQRQMGSSALLLSATLPEHQRQALSLAWQSQRPTVDTVIRVKHFVAFYRTFFLI